MKKLLLIALTVCGLAVGASAQSATPIFRFLPLFTGYNVLIPTNLTGAFGGAGSFAGMGQTNVQYTTYNGQVLYSLTNNNYYTATNSTNTIVANTNIYSADAFQVIHLTPDVNGDIASNATLFIVSGYTNYEPQFYLFTNAYGQTSIFTNNLNGTASTYWPLFSGGAFPNWQYPATPNTYPTWGATQTNAVTISLFASAGDIKGGLGDKMSQTLPQMWETAASYTVTTNLPAGVPNVSAIPLPYNIICRGANIYAQISLVPVTGQLSSTNFLVNQLGILQPQP